MKKTERPPGGWMDALFRAVGVTEGRQRLSSSACEMQALHAHAAYNPRGLGNAWQAEAPEKYLKSMGQHNPEPKQLELPQFKEES